MIRRLTAAVTAWMLAPMALLACSSSTPDEPQREHIGTVSQHLFKFGWSGNTEEGTAASGIVATTSFAVMTRTGPYGDRFGTGFPYFDQQFEPGVSSPPLDTSASYLYVYQDVNLTPSDLPMGEVWTKMPGVSVYQITSWGAFADTGFEDVDGPVDEANPFGWPQPLSPHTAHLGVTSPGVVSIAGGTNAGVNPSVVYLANVWSGSFITFRRRWVGPTGVRPGHRGVIVGYTSNYPPTLNPNGVNPGPVSIPQGVYAAEERSTVPATIAVAEGSADAEGALYLVNLVTGMYLIDKAHITPESAKNIEDAGSVSSIAELESLTTGPDFDRLVTFARNNGYVN